MYLVTYGRVGFFEPPRYDVFPTFLQFYQFLATSLVLSQKFVAEYEFYHHLIPKALFFFFALKYVRFLRVKEKVILLSLFYLVSRYGTKLVFTVKFAR